MKLAIMQPYLLPYLGYLHLLAHAEKFVVFDSVQFRDKGWINRNRILHPSSEKGWQYFTFPLQGKSNFQPIRDVRIKSEFDFSRNLLGKISHLKRAPYYRETVNYIEHLGRLISEKTHITDVNTIILRDLNEVFDLNCEIISEKEICYDSTAVEHSGQWALVISQALRAKRYVNPLSGRDLFDESEFASAGIEIEFLAPKLNSYSQYREAFQPGLSIIDVLLWNGISRSKDIIKRDYVTTR